ncbi:UBE2W enzyme, partial [Horornis vulcanius]|nr:UBE2W enzyme [Horornis vulcanius]
RWIVDMEGAPGTLYEGEKFQLLFKFSSRYPFDSPQVTAAFFLSYCYPQVTADCLIICRSFLLLQRRPPDNSFYVRTCNKNPKKTKWWYHGKYL